ncbi:hypothetical protein ABK040_012917 [Willaertia magna]
MNNRNNQTFGSLSSDPINEFDFLLQDDENNNNLEDYFNPVDLPIGGDHSPLESSGSEGNNVNNNTNMMNQFNFDSTNVMFQQQPFASNVQFPYGPFALYYDSLSNTINPVGSNTSVAPFGGFNIPMNVFGTVPVQQTNVSAPVAVVVSPYSSNTSHSPTNNSNTVVIDNKATLKNDDKSNSSTISVSSPSNNSIALTSSEDETTKQKKKKKKTTKETPSSVKVANSSSDEERQRKKSVKRRKQDEIESDNLRLNDLINKPNNELTKEQREEKKRLRNRQTAKLSREKKKKELEELREKNEELEEKERNTREKYEKLKEKYSNLEGKYNKVVKENEMLRNKLLEQPSCTLDIQSDAFLNDTLMMGEDNEFAQISDNTISTVTTNNNRRSIFSLALFIGFFMVMGALVYFTGGEYRTLFFSNQYNNNNIPQQPIQTRTMGRVLQSFNQSVENNTSVNRQNNREVIIKQKRNYSEKEDTPLIEKESENIITDNNSVDDLNHFGFQFNTDGMAHYDVYYPQQMKRHFSFHNTQSTIDKTNNEEEIHIGKYYSNNSTKHPIDSNNKQMMAISPDVLSKRVILKKHKYEKARVYVPTETDESKNELHLFCPYIYPLLADPKKKNFEFSAKDFDTTKTSVKIHIPVQMLNNKTNTRIIRMAEINADNFKLSEAFYEFSTSSITNKESTTTNAANGGSRTERMMSQ